MRPESVEASLWAPLVACADLRPGSADAEALLTKLSELVASVQLTEDGRLVSESRPTATEIRDPLVNLGVRGAEMLAEYLAQIDHAAMEAILVAGLDEAARGAGLGMDLNRAQREQVLMRFAFELQWLLPAMVHAGRLANDQVKAGRPAAEAEETGLVAAELATIWVEHAEADPSEFHRFVPAFFELCGLPAPSRKRYSKATASLRELTELSGDELHARRLAHRRRRVQLVAECARWGQGHLVVRFWSKYALEGAARLHGAT